MKRQLFTLLLMVLGMTSFAQSGWTDPSNEYQSQTVVYATVDCGGYELYDAEVSPEVAAFVDGELRAVVTRFNLVEREDGDLRIYTLRVGGTAEDDGKEITFKLYDPMSGLIYPLQCSETIEWAADATPAQPSSYYTLAVNPAVRAYVYKFEADIETIVDHFSLRVNDRIVLEEYRYKLLDINDEEVTDYEGEAVWIIGNPNMPYVAQADDTDILTMVGMRETPDNDGDGENDYMPGVVFTVGAMFVEFPTQVLPAYVPVEGINVYMNDEYWISENESVFEFKYNVNPGDATDPSLTVESSNPDVAEVLMSEDASMYRIHAYSTGEVTFTFRSVAHPDVYTEATTVIKREPTGVAIRTIGNIEIPAPGTTPAETVVELALGQNVVAVAGVEPNDATIESFIMDIVDSDDIPFEADVVESGDIIDNGDGTISFSFTFLNVPDRDVYLRAIVNDGLRHKVRLDVKQGVTDIELSEAEKTVWFTQDIETFFSITAVAVPDDATNKNLIINLDGDDVISYEGYFEDGEHRFKIQGKGNATVTFTSEDNPSVSATCEVTVKKRVSDMYVDSDVFFMLYNDGGEYSSVLRYWPEDADFYSENVTINVYSDMESEDWVPVEIHPQDVVDSALELTVIPRALSYFNVDFIYLNPEEGEEISEPLVYNVEGQVQERMTIGGGWNWLSLITYNEMWFEGFAENLIEARSQSQLVYNDPYWGLFGDLEYMDNTQAYKVNMHQDTETILEFWSESNGSGRIEPKSLTRGWNWVSYPYEFGYSADDVFNAGNFSENDMILSLNDGFVVNGGNGYWEGTLGDLTPYQGYMIYCNNDVELEMPRRFDLPQGYFRGNVMPRAAARERSVWQYDNSRFANVMPIIANVDIENCEEYTIGAFVGDECRGEGKFINGKAFISVSGEVGEMVTFHLHNSWTGEFTTITTELAFTDKAGSLQAPVLMGTLDGTTGIVDINTIDGNNIESIYDITGRAVTEMSEGIYILKVREGDKVVTKKVRK